MKKLIGLTGSFVIFCLILNSVLLPSLPQVKAEKQISVPNTVSNTKPESKAPPKIIETTYILKNYNGKIAVYESSSEKPIKITDTDISKLPKEDQAQLKLGIKAKSKSELNRLLEDYCS